MAKSTDTRDTRDKSPKKGADAKDLKRVRKMIRDVRVAMFTTVAADGVLRSRPMVAASPDTWTGELWFVTRASAPKAEEVRDHQHVNVAFSAPDDGIYVSIAGRAAVVRDAEKLRDVWDRTLKPWFPEGKKDPGLALIRVEVERLEYWDAKQNRMVGVGGAPAAPAAPPAAPPDPS